MDFAVQLDAEIPDDQLQRLVRQQKYGRYLEDRSLSQAAARRFLLDRTRRYLKRDDAHRLAAFAAGELQGMLLFRLSDWDTELFGYNVAIIESTLIQEDSYDRQVDVTRALLNRFEGWCRELHVRFVTAKLPALELAAIHGFETSDFRYLETWIHNKYSLPQIDPVEPAEHSLRLAESADYDTMLEHAEGAFASQRFHADPHIAWDQAESLYRKWISTAFRDPEQTILVMKEPPAYLIYHKEDLSPYFNLRYVTWKFILLDPTHRGRGVGTSFLRSAMHWHRREGIDVVDSGLSARNLASLNAHNKLCFNIVSTLVTFHRWLS